MLGGKRPPKHGQQSRSKFTSIENQLLNTYQSGLYISATDFMQIARDNGIEAIMNTRELLIKNLLNTSFDNGTLNSVVSDLVKIIDQRISEYQTTAREYPGAAESFSQLAQKASGIKMLLARETRKSPYE